MTKLDEAASVESIYLFVSAAKLIHDLIVAWRRRVKMASQTKNQFEIPKWFAKKRTFLYWTIWEFLNFSLFLRAGKPVAGLHLDVVKDGRLVQVCSKNFSFDISKVFIFFFQEIDDWWEKMLLLWTKSWIMWFYQ